jgi:hypothetical protein
MSPYWGQGWRTGIIILMERGFTQEQFFFCSCCHGDFKFGLRVIQSDFTTWFFITMLHQSAVSPAGT